MYGPMLFFARKPALYICILNLFSKRHLTLAADLDDFAIGAQRLTVTTQLNESLAKDVQCTFDVFYNKISLKTSIILWFLQVNVIK